LWSKFKQDYNGNDYRSSGGQFLKIVHDVYNECKVSGQDCSDEVLISKYNAILNNEKRPEPFISPDLYQETDEHEYWSIANVEFEAFPPYLWIKSQMIASPPYEFQVSDYVNMKRDKDGNYKISKKSGYDNEFKDWVDWCNYNFKDVGSDGYIPYWMFTKPEWNDEKKRWETEIYIVDSQGKPDSFGYTPIGGEPKADLPPTLIPPTILPEPTKEVPQEKPASQESNSQKLLNKKLGYIEEIKMWKEIGDEKEMKNAILKLKIVNKQIEKLS
jgi:hypothetical protein